MASAKPFEDLTKHTSFGRWTVLRYIDKRNGIRYWWCRCECGREKEVRESYLLKGWSKGCHKCGAKHKKNRSYKFLDLRDQEYGKWTVTKHHRKYKNRTEWLCKCKCGTKKWVSMGNLRSGHSTQCSKCGNQEARQKMRTLAFYHPREYSIWRSHNYYNEMAPEFKTFKAFFATVGECPKGCQLWRSDDDSPYQPGNAEWKHRREVVKLNRDKLIARIIKSNLLDPNDSKVLQRLRSVSRQRLYQLIHQGPRKCWHCNDILPLGVDDGTSGLKLCESCMEFAKKTPGIRGRPRKWQHPTGTRTYIVWSYLLQTKRLVEAWLNYDQFFTDMGERPFKHRLYVPDKTQLVGPGNAVWRPVIRSKKAS